MPGPIFHSPEPPPPQRRAMAERAVTRYPGQFARPDDAADWLGRITMPASQRWAYCGNGKSGTSSTKRFLFELEFGTPLSVNLDHPTDINPDAVPHELAKSGVFRTILTIPAGLAALDQSFRITTARHPVSRAVSSFLYLCQADRAGSPWLATERLRMNATCGFDWTRDAGTSTGFVKFLDHLQQNATRSGEVIEDPHLRPQVRNIRPDIFKPDLIGRTENLGAFFRQIAAHFDTPLPADWVEPASNRSNRPDTPNLLTPEAMRRIAQVFAADFDWLNEDPHSWQA